MPKLLSVLTAATVALLVVGVAQATSDTPPSIVQLPSPQSTLTQLAQDIGGSSATSSSPRLRYLQKIDSHLQDVAASRLGGGTPADAKVAARRQGIVVSQAGGVLVDVYVNGDLSKARDNLRALGMKVHATSSREPERMVEGFLPSDELATAAALSSTHAIISSPPPAADTGSVTSQGDAAIDGPQARALGSTGAGVRVGIISTSLDELGGGVATSQASGDLPADVQDLADNPNDPTDEGRAMAEIVSDEAPGSSIAFASGTLGGAATKADSIDALVSHGAKVIADDIGFFDEPFFQDGILSQAVDRSKAAGVAYFSAAGNQARQSWEAIYTPVADPSGKSPTTEDFDPGAGVDTVQTIASLPANALAFVSLEWAEPWGRATTDFALDVYKVVGGVPSFLFTIDTNNIATGLPDEYLPIQGGSSTTTIGIAIRRVSGFGTPLLKYVTGGDETVAIEHPTNSSAISPEASSANGALTVAASDFSTPTTPESFSSRGPVTRLFDVNGNPLSSPEVRQKPDLAGPDGVSTTVTGLSTFFGTSAATPGVAGIAALIRSAKPAMPVDEVYAIMTDSANARSCTSSSPLQDCGAGLVLADKALAMALDSTAPAVTPTVTPAAPDGPNGWYHAPVNVSWNESDGDSPLVDVTGCNVVVPADQVAALTCSATSAGGTTSVPLTIKRDSTPPSAPTISGIAARAYTTATVPPAPAIGCVASDPTSGVDSCAVTGYDAGLGSHTLTATATDDAGFTSASTLAYTVVAVPVVHPNAISQLTLPKTQTLAALARSGIPVTLHVANVSTSIVVKLALVIPKAKGHKARTITLGTVTRKVTAGLVKVHIKLTAKWKRQIATTRKSTLTITASGASSGATGASLKGSIVVLN